MTNNVSVKMSQEAITFTDNANTNMIRAGVIEKALSRTAVWDKLVRYNKLNNDRYIEFIKMEIKENGS